MTAPGEEWTDWVWKQITIDTNCREIIDNVVDMAHFFYVHYGFPIKFENIFEGHIATQFHEGVGREDMARPTKDGQAASTGNSSVAAYYGPSFMIDELTYHYPDFDIDSILINCHYPISPNKFVLMYGIKVKQSESVRARRRTHWPPDGQVHRDRVRAGRRDLEEQDPHREPAAVRGRRPRLPAPPLVRAVLRRRRRHQPGHDQPFRIRDGHHQAVAAWRREVAENMERRAASAAIGN